MSLTLAKEAHEELIHTEQYGPVKLRTDEAYLRIIAFALVAIAVKLEGR